MVSSSDILELMHTANLNAIAPRIAALLAGGAKLDSSAARCVLSELDQLLSLCRAAASSSNNTCISELMTLLARSIAVLPESEVHACFSSAAGDRHWQAFAALVEHLGFQLVMGRAVTLDVLNALLALTPIAPLKDVIGASLIPGLAMLIHDPDASFGSEIQRLSATCLIQLVNGSKENKARLEPHLPSVIDVINTTGDFFLQLQCGELLFRLTRMNPTILQRLPGLSPMLRSGFATVPHDATMLDRIIALLETFDRAQTPPKILVCELTSLCVVGSEGRVTEVCGATKAYFSKDAAVVMLPGPIGTHLVLEYATLASVRLNSDNQFLCRCRQPPSQLAEIMRPNELLRAGMTPAFGSFLRQSPLHQWILASRQTALTSASPVGLSHAAQTSGFTRGDMQTAAVCPLHQLSEPPPVRGVPASVPRPQEPKAYVRPRTESPSRAPQPQPSIAMRDCTNNSFGGVKSRPSSVAIPSRAPSVAIQRTATLPVIDFSSAGLGADEPVTRNENHPGRFTAAFNEGHNTGLRTSAAMEETTAAASTTTVDEVLQHVKNQLASHVDWARAEARRVIDSTSTSIREKMQRVADENRRDRDEFELMLSREMGALRQEEASTRGFILEIFDTISADLENVRAIGELVDERLASLTAGIEDVVQQSRDCELVMLKKFKDAVDSDMATLEAMLLRAASTINAQRVMHLLTQRAGTA